MAELYWGEPEFSSLEELPHLDDLRAQLAVFFPTLSHDGLCAMPPVYLAAGRVVPGDVAPAGRPKASKRRRRKTNRNRASNRKRRRQRNKAVADSSHKDDGGDGGDSGDGTHTQAQQQQRQRTRAVYGPRLQCILKRNQAFGRWRRAWQARQALGMALQTMAPAPPPVYPRRGNGHGGPSLPRGDKSLLPLPPLPPPLAPCLQCVLAGACCSLTTTPYARDYVNDCVNATRRAGAGAGAGAGAATATAAAGAARVATTAALWKTEHARLVRAVDRVLAAKRPSSSSSSSSSSSLPAAAPNWQALKKALARRRQALEQRVLRLAVARGERDAPFLARPPAQCVRCVREGEAACLQQSADMTAWAAADDGSSVDVAWFASSGPPPVSLLPQHCRPLPEQMAVAPWDGDGRRDRQRRCRPRPRPPPSPLPLRLEAVFCRDPSVLSPPAVAAKAQHLLARIAQMPRRQQQRTLRSSQAPAHALAPLPPLLVFRSPRPATPRELARLLPRRSPCNAYAGRGVATAALLASAASGRPRAGSTDAEDVDAEGDDLGGVGSAFAPAPPPVPCWNSYGQKTKDGDRHAERKQQQAAVYDRREYFLDVGEQRVAAVLRRQRQEQQQQDASSWRSGRLPPCLDDDNDDNDDDDNADAPPSPLSPPTPPADDYIPPAEPRHRALLQHALEVYRAAHPAAAAGQGAAEGVPAVDDDAAVDPCFPLQYRPSSPPSPPSPHAARNHRPWSEEQTDALLRERMAAAAGDTGGRTRDTTTPSLREDDEQRRRRLQQQQQQQEELRALAKRFGVSLERLAERRRQQLRCRREGKSG